MAKKMEKELIDRIGLIVSKQFDTFIGAHVTESGAIKKTVLGRRLELHLKVTDVKAGIIELDFNSRVKEKPDFNIQNGSIVLDANENQVTMSFDEDSTPDEESSNGESGKIALGIGKKKSKK